MSEVEQKTLKVPGAVLYYEVRGQGPLFVLIPGGPTDADTVAGLAKRMADHYTVVSYDPRGNSRSVFDDQPVLQNMDTHGDDLAALIRSIAKGPALVFGTSGGAQIGLNFTARYPTLVRRLVAHEPPCISLLPNAAEVSEKMRGVVHKFHREGAEVAMDEFLRIAGMPSPVRREGSEKKAPPPRVLANLNYFLEFGVEPIGEYKPDIEKLRERDVVVAAGRESKGQLAYRTAEALAERLKTELVLFPHDHGSWARKPDEFAEVLRTVLQDAK